jgi:hypothetical protein
LEWFAFLLFERKEDFSPILAGRSLFQEFLVDMYVVVERSRLQFITFNQGKLKAAQYDKLISLIDGVAPSCGRRIILPSSFIGSPRYMRQLYQDSMAICRKYGPPSLFITMTANPRWKEIQDLLKPGQKAYDNPTIVARVFRLKSRELLHQLVKLNRLGKVIAYVSTIEFQKRGLPHIHLMLTLDEKDRPITPEKIDLLVNAEIPNKEDEPKLHSLISDFMLHGPCNGRACWTEKGCRLGFPKPLTPRTVTVDGTYPIYRRRENGPTIQKFTTQFNNGSVVPFNKYLSLMFECHINVEVPVSSSAIKYLYKYITKGHDRSYLKIQEEDETKAFVDARYISPPEGEFSCQYSVGLLLTLVVNI